MKAKGSELIFISLIHRNGKDISVIEDQDRVNHLKNIEFNLVHLSITLGTYIASEFNSYVVKLKNNAKDDKIQG